ncbi:MAG: cation transporter [Candidatus Marinimicrobia bacterium]|jgi:cobalt-zinc-cadmium efflux system protein|nr:cation transporter [Candidatus Neomarinimicrobiota bacterium]MBT3633808.1 cation transporter [Candidatus Neomarinimicrobiota bacterium]MBT3682600.1 cation transporter [Candidatus Neomarinimicrobiota bacterium]MBT3759364.1 cation transporter [Candidatus Neomarinimicrobiota bacterium]MBT3894628.1 cation transporter [Candidatus Neomarinimicrobiota bacterium]
MHDHMQGATTIRKHLWWAFWINFIFFIIELFGGIYSNSLALLSDAGHMFTDVMALGLAIFASKIGEKIANAKWTYGFMRAEVIGAFINGATLVFICGFILIEAFERIGSPQNILGGPMLIIAVSGLFANGISAWILSKDHQDNMNIKGAYLHLLADTLGSVGAIISGLAIWLWNFTVIDIIASIFIVILILIGTKSLLEQSVKLLMDTVPEHLDYNTIKESILSLEHIEQVHDLHIWSISQNKPSLSAHLKLCPECTETHHWSKCLKNTQTFLAKEYGIEHCTLQIEPMDFVEEDHCG